MTGILLVAAAIGMPIWGPFFTGMNYLASVLLLFVALRVGSLPLICADPECGKRMWFVRRNAPNILCSRSGAPLSGRLVDA
jgi:hypothetical protein